ncbi:MAG TPA: hypothetical protein VFD30_20455 [Terriglobia bacterium]|nr:hypothetical protein [Terriglobia bacterium]
MPCRVVRLKDGTPVLANMRAGAKLSERDRQTLEEYAEFCREQAAEAQRKRNQELLPGGNGK